MSSTAHIDAQRRALQPATARVSTLAMTRVLALVVVAATVYGLVTDAYRETSSRELLGAALRGQDVLTLLVVPVLLRATTLARRGSLRAHLVSLGVLLYIPYTYLMYVVLPYNDAFLLYVAAIGLGSYLLLDRLLRIDVRVLRDTFADLPRRGIGWFLIGTGTMFATVWLIQNLSVIPGGIPVGLFVYDIPSTVHVLDLAFILPTVVAAGVLLLRGHPAGGVLAVVMLVKMIILGLALLFMNSGTVIAGGTFNIGEGATWLSIVVVATTFGVLTLRRMRPTRQPWLRPSLWQWQ